ncbi:Rv0361 family membrane protein [Glycomyces salinus]|uniref:Rv0361 family membrane protein n=1 Tax=Glycomyces salinus TaxID=980294 RepID=UPI0018EAF8A9|nr:DUF4878 domain-containing protein [Glycomyces salinus]
MNDRTKLRPARLTALAGGAFALTMALAACGGSNDTPDGAVENFYDNGAQDIVNAMVDGDFEGAADTAEDYFCAGDVDGIREVGDQLAELPEDMSDEALQELASDVEIPDGFEYEIGDVTEDGDTATVNVEVTADGETTENSHELTKEDDEWKICGEFAM